MKKNNANLYKAKNRKNDEFYTLYEDIENELKHYTKDFEDKVIYLNADDPDQSNFWKYFKNNFNSLKLKKLICTYFKEEENTRATILTDKVEANIPLKGNGDFRSEECIKYLKESDIVITNPPFSLFGEFIDTLMKYNKKFLVIGSKNIVSKKEIVIPFMEGKLWTGVNHGKMSFKTPSGELETLNNIRWYTNLKNDKENEFLELTMKYYGNEDFYTEYYNYDAINVDRVKDIPKDYYGEMGVPITFLDIYNPKQFKISGISNKCIKTKYDHRRVDDNTIGFFDENDNLLWSTEYSVWEAKAGNSLRLKDENGNPGKLPYGRVIIKRRHNELYR